MWLRIRKREEKLEEKKYVPKINVYHMIKGSDDLWEGVYSKNGRFFVNKDKNKIAVVRRYSVYFEDLDGKYEALFIPLFNYPIFEGYFVEVSKEGKRRTYFFDTKLNKVGETEPYDLAIMHEFCNEGLELILLEKNKLIESVLKYSGEYVVRKVVEDEFNIHETQEDILNPLLL